LHPLAPGACWRRCRAPASAGAASNAAADTGAVTDKQTTEITRWTIHGERIVDDTRRARLSIVEVELPDGVRFEQYVIRAPKAAMVAVVDEEDRLLVMWRHRFVIDRWVWELPGGYLDETEDAAVTAAREVEEETGWRPRSVEPMLSFQPWVGTADAENLLFLGRGADYIGDAVDINEAERVAWIPLDEAQRLIASGEIVGAGSIIAVLDLVARKQRGERLN
jgi:8-oxo-dGTP pyrophosphatase MutT (NUDIX family)